MNIQGKYKSVKLMCMIHSWGIKIMFSKGEQNDQ